MNQAGNKSRITALTAWPRGEDGAADRAKPSETRTVAERGRFTGIWLTLTGGSSEGGTVSTWGRGSVSRLDRREGELNLDGKLGNLMPGPGSCARAPTSGPMLPDARQRRLPGRGRRQHRGEPERPPSPGPRRSERSGPACGLDVDAARQEERRGRPARTLRGLLA